MTDSTTPIGIFGQSQRLYGLYTQLCFLFPLHGLDTCRQKDIQSYLHAGLDRLATSVPWLGGSVIRLPSGEYVVQSTGRAPTLDVQDLRDSLPGYHAMREARFPFSMLDERVITPRPTLPTRDEVDPPVMMLQASFINNGLLLVVAAQHNCMDLRGEAQCIELFAKACRGDDFTTEELAIAKTTTIDLSRGAQTMPIKEPENIIITSSTLCPRSAVQSQDPPKPRWVYFVFSSSALKRLKQTAELTKSVSFVSTDDALSALLWQAVTRTRKHRFSATDTTSTFERQVDARKHLAIPHAYMGNLVYKSQTTLLLSEVLDRPLGELASHLRRALEPEPNILAQMRDSAAKLRREMGTNQSASRGSVPVTDMKLSSWAREDCCKLDFGGQLGVPEAVRRPSFEAWEGLAYFMPKGRGGEIAVALCIRENELAELRADETFCGFGEYIG